jgi:MFS family permease
MLWGTNVIAWLGTWFQNTGAGWMMTALAPDPLMVSLVQAATILPVCLLALPAGAIADIVDKRRFLIGTQVWTLFAACLLAAATLLGLVSAWTLLLLTFCIGIGAAMTNPAWSAIVSELVPRKDLVQAVALGGIGFNATRAIGPALAGALLVLGGVEMAFLVYVATIPPLILALLVWRRREPPIHAPREQLLSAMRAGMRFVRNTPAMRAAMWRSAAYSVPAAAPWALLPLVVREQLGLDAGWFGIILGVMGVGGVSAGMLLPLLRARFSRGALVLLATLCSCAGVALLGLARHWAPALLGMALFGLGWVSAYSTLMATAQLVAPPWVRARALAIYQLSYNLTLAAFSFFWGWVGLYLGLSPTLMVAALTGALLAAVARGFGLDQSNALSVPVPRPDTVIPAPEAPAAELQAMLPRARNQVLEVLRYRVSPSDRASFLAVMAEVRRVRGRAGAVDWQLFEDIAHPDTWLEAWVMQDWAEHLREAGRISEEDHAVLAAAAAFQEDRGRASSRYLAVDPDDAAHQALPPSPRQTSR